MSNNDNEQTPPELLSNEGLNRLGTSRSRREEKPTTTKPPAPNFARLHKDVDGVWRATSIAFNGQKSYTVLGRLGGANATAPSAADLVAELEKQGFTVGKLPDESTEIRAGSAYLLDFTEQAEPTANEKLIAYVAPSQLPKRSGLIDQAEIDRRRNERLSKMSPEQIQAEQQAAEKSRQDLLRGAMPIRAPR